MNAPPAAPTEATLPVTVPSDDPTHRWFSPNGCVVWRQDGVRQVFVGGFLISFFTEGETVNRNIAVVQLAQAPNIQLGRLAWAFGISSEALRVMRRRFEKEGFKALVSRRKGGRPSVVPPGMERRLEKLFEQGLSVTEAHVRVVKEGEPSRAKVGEVRKAWAKRKAGSLVPEPPAQLPLVVEARPKSAPARTDDGVKTELPQFPKLPSIRVAQPSDDSEYVARTPSEAGCPEEDAGAIEPVEEQAPRNRRHVQFVGAWLLLATIARLGVYDWMKKLCAPGLQVGKLRVAFDAVAIALAVGERCVEGVRRLATSGAAALLLAASAPSASWVRRTLGRFAANNAGMRLHWGMGGELIRRAADRSKEHPAVFYVDNHLRPYTGKKRVRWGWRMQDKRSRPGVTDYWVHDADGRPLWRVAVPSHESLASFLIPIAMVLRVVLGEQQRILVAFDRGGAYPEPMADLRSGNVEFVTYERRPFRHLSRREFDRTLELDGEKVGLHESHANLGRGRGRVRRISLRMQDGSQVNLLAVSEEEASWLVEVMSGRWCQENGFKHGVERWGLNQLDGRRFAHYAPDDVIPNPARRRLEHALKLLRVREGELRNQLARLGTDAPEREELRRDLDETLRSQRVTEALRPSEPEHVTVAEAGLDGKLAKHVDEYKAVIDTIRVAAANVETDLAAQIAPHLRRPREAKRVLRNLFKAPGSVTVTEGTITVRLDVAATRDELNAIDALFRAVNRTNLRLPGDTKGRRLCFRSQNA